MSEENNQLAVTAEADKPNKPDQEKTKLGTWQLKNDDYIFIRGCTSSFQGKGRKARILFSPSRDGQSLLPGKYDYQDFVSILANKTHGPTYGSRNTGRGDEFRPNKPVRAKTADTILLGPGSYETQRYFAIGAETKRRPISDKQEPSRMRTYTHKKKEISVIPGPGNYNIPSAQSRLAISSSFLSKSARFRSSTNRVPGPGSYDGCMHTPNAADNLAKVGKLYGLFFPVDYYP